MTSEGLSEQELAAKVADQRVARGAALLDRALPGWAQLIDLGKLDLSDTTMCVLGQLFEDRLEEKAAAPEFCDSNFAVGRHVLGLDGLAIVQHGFDKFSREMRPSFRELDDAWERAVKERHDAGFPPSSRSVSSVVDLSGKRP